MICGWGEMLPPARHDMCCSHWRCAMCVQVVLVVGSTYYISIFKYSALYTSRWYENADVAIPNQYVATIEPWTRWNRIQEDAEGGETLHRTLSNWWGEMCLTQAWMRSRRKHSFVSFLDSWSTRYWTPWLRLLWQHTWAFMSVCPGRFGNAILSKCLLASWNFCACV